MRQSDNSTIIRWSCIVGLFVWGQPDLLDAIIDLVNRLAT